MEESIDHYIGSKVFDLNQKSQISYAKIVPYQYAIISPPYVDEFSSYKILEYENLFESSSYIDFLKTWYTPDLSDILGYSLYPKISLPYSQTGIFGEYYNCPELPVLQTLNQQDYEIFTHGNYILKGGNTKSFEVSIRAGDRHPIEYFSELEKFDEIRAIVKNYQFNKGKFPVYYIFDLEDLNTVQLNILTPFIPFDSSESDIALNRDSYYYKSIKQEYYSKFVIANILTKEEYDYIFEVSPTAESTILKFKWTNKELIYKELESFSVFQFRNVWSRF